MLTPHMIPECETILTRSAKVRDLTQPKECFWLHLIHVHIYMYVLRCIYRYLCTYCICIYICSLYLPLFSYKWRLYPCFIIVSSRWRCLYIKIISFSRSVICARTCTACPCRLLLSRPIKLITYREMVRCVQLALETNNMAAYKVKYH